MRRCAKLVMLCAVAVLASLLAFVGAASAAWPGANGKIVFMTGDPGTQTQRGKRPRRDKSRG